MKKTTIFLFLIFISLTSFADDKLILITQRNTSGIGSYSTYPIFPTATSGPALSVIDLGTQLPGYLTIGSGLSSTNGVLSATGGSQVNADWNATSGLAQILNKPSIPTAVSALTNDSGYITSSALSPYATTASLTSGLAGKYSNPTGTTAQYLRGDGSVATFPNFSTVATSGIYADLTNKPALATVATSGSYSDLSNKPTIPAAYLFSFSAPVARTLALATSYSATDTTKPAIITASVSCAATLSGTTSTPCTVQARVSATTASCSTGTVVSQWEQSKTGGLGLNNVSDTNGYPGDIKLPSGYSFILCQTSGTGATIPVAVEQVAG